MLTVDDYTNLDQYAFKNSPESYSDNSCTTDVTDLQDLQSSDEDFLQQLSCDLDIPLLLNPGEDEMTLLNSFFDKSPEEILSEITVPPDIITDDLRQWNHEDFSNLIKSESDSSSSKSSTPPPNVKVGSAFPYTVNTPQIVPEVKSIPKIVVKDELKIEPKSPCSRGRLVPQKTPVKRPIHAKTTPYQNKSNVVLISNTNVNNPIVSSQPTAPKVLVLENIVPNNSLPTTTINVNSISTTNPVSSVVLNGNNVLSLNNVDPKIMKKLQRKIKNRESACLSRKKKKDYLTSLENQVKELTHENEKLKMQNIELKEKLSKYENSMIFSHASKNMKGSLVLCVVLLVLGVNIDYLKSPFFNRQAQDVYSSIPKLHGHGRNLLWAINNDKTDNDTDHFHFLTMCPAAVNQTESARLVLELERWIGKPKKIDENFNVTKLTKPKVTKKRKLINKKRLISQSSLQITTMDNNNQQNGINNELKLFSASDSKYRDFFEAINRQDDTFYVVSLSSHNMLLPALYHNKTRRPKMSLIMPSIMPMSNGNSSNLTFVPLMQIDCEVLDTRLIKVQYGLIPQHLKTFESNKTQSNDDNVKENVNSNEKASNYTNKKPYKPYFINDESGFYNIP